jgi:hypothetical protein
MILYRWILLLSVSVTGLCFAAPTYEEVGYESLLQELSQKRQRQTSNNEDPFESILLHANIGLVTSMTSLHLQGADTQRFQNGMQIGLGIDLFSSYWSAEVQFRNYGLQNNGTETRGLREFDLNLNYMTAPRSAPTSFRITAGLGTRYYKLVDPFHNYNIEQTTPSFLGGLGMDLHLNKFLSAGFQIGARTSMVSNTIDKNSLDAAFRIDTSF